MAILRDRIESAFERLAHFLYRWRFLVILVMGSLIGFLCYQVTHITVDTSSEALLRETDPYRVTYDAFRDQFGRSEVLIIAVEPPEIFDLKFFEKLAQFQEALEDEIPYVKKITSLVSVRDTRGEGDTLVVEDLLENFPETPEDLAALKKRTLENPFYKNYVISENHRFAALVVETEAVVSENEENDDAFLAGFGEGQAPAKPQKPRYFGEKENREVVQAAHKVAERFQAPDCKIVISGGPVVVDTFNRYTLQDTRQSVMLAVLANMIFLLLLFRRLTGVFFPLFIVVSASMCTLGLMALFHVPMKTTTTIIPGFLVAVGVADSVHILAIFYREFDGGKNKEDAIAAAMAHSGLAVVMTSLTTAAGLLSFSFAELAALGEVGVFAAAGVMLALFYTVTILPALLAIAPVRRRKVKVGGKGGKGRMDRLLLGFADFAIRLPKAIILVSAALLLFSLVGLVQLKFSNNVVDYFPEDMPENVDLNLIDEVLRGVVTLEVVADTGKPKGVLQPEFLSSLDRASETLSRYRDPEIFVGKVFSVADVIKEINKAMHGNDDAYYTIPDDPNVIAQEILLFEGSGSDDLESLTDSVYSKARITIKTPWVDSVVYERFLDRMGPLLRDYFGGTAKITLTGIASLMARTIPATLKSMAESYVIAFVTITLMMLFLVGSWRIGLLAMFPNLLPIAFIMGIIGLLNMPLNLNTIMIGSISIGLVVDDTMHFMYNFRKYYDHTGDPAEAIRRTMVTTGRALLITSLVLASGFFVLMACFLENFQVFGFFTGLIILVALLADFVLAPALMAATFKKKQPETLKA